eukprot:scaffold1443_cov260-Prasinococcus_capsulatus_cf.AAC.2
MMTTTTTSNAPPATARAASASCRSQRTSRCRRWRSSRRCACGRGGLAAARESRERLLLKAAGVCLRASQVAPSPLLRFHVLDVLYSYCFTCLVHNGDWEADLLTAVGSFFHLSGVLSHQEAPASFSRAFAGGMERVAGELGHGRRFAVQLLGEVLNVLDDGVEAVLLALVDAKRHAERAVATRGHHGIPRPRRPPCGLSPASPAWPDPPVPGGALAEQSGRKQMRKQIRAGVQKLHFFAAWVNAKRGPDFADMWGQLRFELQRLFEDMKADGGFVRARARPARRARRLSSGFVAALHEVGEQRRVLLGHLVAGHEGELLEVEVAQQVRLAHLQHPHAHRPQLLARRMPQQPLEPPLAVLDGVACQVLHQLRVPAPLPTLSARRGGGVGSSSRLAGWRRGARVPGGRGAALVVVALLLGHDDAHGGEGGEGEDGLAGLLLRADAAEAVERQVHAAVVVRLPAR